MPYVYSTATCPISYVKYEDPIQGEKKDRASSGYNKILHKVTINGGHGVSNKYFETPMGVATHVSEDDLDFLLQDEHFQMHKRDGFVSHDKKKVDPSKKAANMALKDGSAPLTPKDFEKGENDSDDLRVYKGIPKNIPL